MEAPDYEYREDCQCEACVTVRTELKAYPVVKVGAAVVDHKALAAMLAKECGAIAMHDAVPEIGDSLP